MSEGQTAMFVTACVVASLDVTETKFIDGSPCCKTDHCSAVIDIAQLYIKS